VPQNEKAPPVRAALRGRVKVRGRALFGDVKSEFVTVAETLYGEIL
jgi:hypothetical protein